MRAIGPSAPEISTQVAPWTSAETSDFSDPESQRVLGVMAPDVAYELGRQAAQEFVAELNAQQVSA
jgi:hypothetical protein